MRIVIIAITMVFLFGMLAVYWTNADTTVDFTIGGRVFTEVHLWVLILASVLAGCLLVGVVAVLEGTVMRFTNTRLRRKIHKMENEMHYLRTQPPTTDPGLPASPEPEESTELPRPPSAPVYGVEDERDEDDLYTGGRAV